MGDTRSSVAVASGNIKGTGIIGIVRAMRARRDQAQAVLPEKLQHYLDHRVAITAWYPEADYLALMNAFMRVYKGLSWEAAGATAAQDALSGVYRNIIVVGDVHETARRMRVNWRNYHDTGELSVDLEPKIVRVHVRDYCMVSNDLCRLNQGYFATLLSLAGAQIAEQRKVRCTAWGAAECVWEYGYVAGAPRR